MNKCFLFIPGVKNGDFCYNLDGSRGNVDGKIHEIPINVECDSRLSCANSVRGAECNAVEGMTEIQVSPNKQSTTFNKIKNIFKTCWEVYWSVLDCH